MRKIMFRGKRFDNGEWLYGDLMHVNEQVMINPVFDEPYQYDGDLDANVDPETVGQFIGLRDKNEKEGCHGDLCSFHGVIYTLEWDEEESGFYLKHPHKHATIDDHMSTWHFKHCEIIGNIYDNPELLK